jgi:tetratricopeptide (TPR) repeat protein
MSRTKRMLLVGVLLIVGSVMLHGVRGTVRREMPERGLTHQEVLQARGNNAFAYILGELRATTGDFLYAKSQTYMHNGVVYRSDAAHARGTRHVEEDEDDHEQEGHEGEVALIRSRENDFRGLIGYFERQVKPFDAPGQRSGAPSGVELLPWYRLMTVIDPTNVMSYISGGYWLARVREHEKALEMIDEGLENNPGHPLNFQLYLSKASIYSRQKNYEAALAEVEKGVEWALKVRPESGEIGTRLTGRLIWSEMAEEDYLFLLRYRTLFLLELGRREEALESALELFRLDPDDAPNRRTLHRLLSEPQ